MAAKIINSALILGVASIGAFIEKGKWKNLVRNVLFYAVFAFPLAIPFAGHFPNFMLALNIAYVLFFGIVGQFYSVVLVGILISKFSSKN